MFMVSHRVNNWILNLAHLTRVAHPHQVTRAPFTWVTLLHRVLGNVAGTGTSHLGNTSGNVIYVDANSPYTGGVSLGNPGSFSTANQPYPGGMSTLGNSGFSAHTTPTNPNPNFQQPYYQTMSYGPNIPPRVRVFCMILFPNIFFPRTSAYATPNPRVGDNEGVRDQIARTLQEFGFTPRG
jgi:hypothetical protein